MQKVNNFIIYKPSVCHCTEKIPKLLKYLFLLVPFSFHFVEWICNCKQKKTYFHKESMTRITTTEAMDYI